MASQTLGGSPGEIPSAETRRPEPIVPDADVWAHFLRASPDLFCIADFDGNFRFLSPGWSRLLVQSDAYLRSVPFVEHVHPEDREATGKATAALGEGDNVVLFENRYRHRDGTYIPLMWNATADVARGFIYATARDITLMKAHEAARVRLFGLATHDLAAPITALKLKLAKQLFAGHADAEALVTLERAVTRLERLLGDVRTAAMLEENHIELDPQPTNLGGVLGPILDELSAMSERRCVPVTVEGDGIVWADPHRLGQIAYNLLWNAFKFSRRGDAIAIRMGEDHGCAWLEIQDHGRGLAANEIRRLFRPYSQVHDPGEFIDPGTGLGLYICRRLTEAHGGSITVTSPGLGEGATFRVSLPAPPMLN